MKSLAECLDNLLARTPHLSVCRADLTAAAAAMTDCARAGGTLFFGGNGGSCADAEHIVGEFLKSFELPRPLPAAEQDALRQEHGEAGARLADGLEVGIRAIALSAHPAFLSAMANDVGWDIAWAQQLYALSRPGDVFLGLTTSGNSTNILHAARVSRLRGLTCLGLTGEDGGRLKDLSDHCIRVPAVETARIQELHLQVYHWLCATVEEQLFG